MKNSKKKKNKYEQIVDAELDLHGLTQSQAKSEIEKFLEYAENNSYKKIRIITGKGLHSKDKAVLRKLTENYLLKNNYIFTRSKYNEGGSGAFDVTI